MRKWKRAKASRGEFIASIVALSFLFVLFAVIFIWMIPAVDYPASEELVYEECTFVRYEISKTRNSKIYRVYLEEYEEPVRIDKIVSKSLNSTVDTGILYGLREGDKVTVSVDEDGDLYAMAYGESYILSYEDFLSAHESNHTLAMIVLPVFMCLSAAIIVGECFKIKRS